MSDQWRERAVPQDDESEYPNQPFAPYHLPSLNGIQWLMSLCGLDTSPSLLWVLNSSRDKVIKSMHAWLKVQVFRGNNLLSPWHSQGRHWMLNISKSQYVHTDIWTMFCKAPFSLKPLFFKDKEFSSLNCKWDLGQPVGQYALKCKSLFCWYSRNVW